MSTLPILRLRVWRTSAIFLCLLVLSAAALTPCASAAGSSNAQRQDVAERDIATLLGAAPLPHGSRQITAKVAESTKPFSAAKSISYPGNEVGATRFFVAPAAQSSLAWLKSQRLDGHDATGAGFSGATTTQIYQLPNSSFLLEPQVVYVALTKSDGSLEFSVTATVWWQSPKTSGAIVAPHAAKLTVRLNRGLNDKKHRYQSASTTTSSLISSVTRRIDVLRVASPLPTSCPMDVGSSITMSFYHAGATHPYAVVTADPSGCGTVTVTQYNINHQVTSSSDLTGGRQLSSFVAAHFGLSNISPT